MDGVVVKRYRVDGGRNDKCYLSLVSPQDLSPKVLRENLKLPPHIEDDGIECSSCGGLLYLDDYEGNIMLCNLTTKEIKFLPRPKLEPPPNKIFFDGSGLGYDSKSDDFKVIRNFHHRYYKIEDCGIKIYLGCEDHTELYSLKGGVWKSIPSPDATTDPSNGVYVSGSCYWLARIHSNFDGPSSNGILSFDFTKESFHVLHKPPSTEEYSNLVFNLVEYHGSLGAIGYELSGIYKCFELWVREDKTWAKVFNILLSGVERPLGLKDGRLLFLEGRERRRNQISQLVVYDWIANEWKKLDIYDYPYQMNVAFYVESQVALPDASPMQRSYMMKRKKTRKGGLCFGLHMKRTMIMKRRRKRNVSHTKTIT